MNESAESQTSDDPPNGKSQSRHTPVVLQSSLLFQGANEVHIQHGNETYRLRVTKVGKLILQK
jgi:hemin uptake protein HemP